MLPVSTRELLEYRRFRNKTSGSKVVFDGRYVVINEQIIGEYRLQSGDDCERLVITTEEHASIDLIIKIEVEFPEEVLVRFFLEDESEPFLELEAE